MEKRSESGGSNLNGHRVFVSKSCQKCNKKSYRLWETNGLFLCYFCYRKNLRKRRNKLRQDLKDKNLWETK